MKYTKVRELVPPMWPPDNFTMDEARRAIREVEAEDEERRKAKGRRSGAAAKKGAQDGGKDP
jgi:hypothetical protein